MAGEEKKDRLAASARRARELARHAEENPEPSLGVRLGQVGVVGWMVVLPALAGAFLGRRLDAYFETRVFFSAPLLLGGAALGFWSAWKWMHRK